MKAQQLKCFACGGIILANTEEWPQPLCYEHYEQLLDGLRARVGLKPWAVFQIEAKRFNEAARKRGEHGAFDPDRRTGRTTAMQLEALHLLSINHPVFIRAHRLIYARELVRQVNTWAEKLKIKIYADTWRLAQDTIGKAMYEHARDGSRRNISHFLTDHAYYELVSLREQDANDHRR